MYAGAAAAMLVVEPRGGRAVPAAARLGERRLGSKRGGRVSEVAMRGSEGTVAERIEAGGLDASWRRGRVTPTKG